MKKTASITTLPRSPQEDRHDRMVKYALAMGVRLICIIACLFVTGWWLALCIAGAVILPYIAVVLANVGGPKPGGAVERPGAVEIYRPSVDGEPLRPTIVDDDAFPARSDDEPRS